MNITFYTNTSENISLDKNINELVSVTGNLRDTSSITDPIIQVVNIDAYVGVINYAFIPEFRRYYFVRDIRSIRNGIWEITMHVDVLKTYANEIRDNTAIIERNEYEYDLKLNDGLFQTQQNPRIAQFNFPSGFNTWDFVLAIAGN